MRYLNLNSILFAPWRRIVSFVLAMVLFTTSAPIPVFSVENGEQGNGGQSGSVSTPNSGELIYDYDTLKITQKGEQISHLDLLSHEKIEIEAEGLTEDADYQWQVQHPEKDDLWVNVYDGTNQTISVTLALVGNVLRADGTAKLRCRAYTDDFAYMTSPVTVKLLSQETTMRTSAVADSNDGIMLLEDTQNPEFVTITINYVQYDIKWEDGKMVVDGEGNPVLEKTNPEVFTSYRATLAYGGTLPANTVVKFPTMVGYDRYFVEIVDGKMNKQDTVDLKAKLPDEITQDVTYEVRYMPKNVDYVVRYFLQNVYDDQYVEDVASMQTAKGLTGSAPSAEMVGKDFPGFTSMFYQPEAIAADGSTVFQVYYERNYYLMEFDCGGGYGADPVYVRYGTYVSVPDPVRSGWDFAGWGLVETKDELDNVLVTDNDANADTLPDTMPAYNSSYVALWEQGPTTFTVIYWVQDADDDEYSYAYSVDEVPSKTGTVINLDNIAGVYTDGTNSVTITTALPENHALKNYSSLDADAISAAYDKENGTLVNYGTGGVSVYGVQLQGDGSSVFNIYYKRNEYTLRFVYARKDTTDGKIQIATNTTNSYTYKKDAQSTPAGKEITDNQIWETTVSALPTVTADDAITGTFTEGNYEYYYFSITARYRQNIEDLWPATADLTGSGDLSQVGDYKCVGWCAHWQSNYADSNYLPVAVVTGTYATLDDQILMDSAKTAEKVHTLLAHWTDQENLWEYRFYVGVTSKEHEEDPGATYIEKDFSTAHPYWHYWKLVDSQITYSFSVSQNDQPRATIPGIRYTARENVRLEDLDNDGVADDYVLIYYYYRYEHSLIFSNYGETLLSYKTPFEKPTTHGGSTSWVFQDVDGVKGEYQWAENIWNLYESEYAVDYGVSLKSHVTNADGQIEAAYPSTLEPGAYNFAGWYTGPNGSGEKVAFDDGEERHENGIWYNPTMPDDDLILFAYWKPVVWDVYFYFDYDQYSAEPPVTWDQTNPNGDPVRVQHGKLLGSSEYKQPTKDGYHFIGWFYLDVNGKKKFAPDSMEVKKTLHLFAEWISISGTPTQYKVTYTFDGEKIAESSEGYAGIGRTKTFQAKGGAALYGDYQTKYFPEVASHSILMKEMNQDGTTPNTYNFIYVKDDDGVFYKIRCVDVATNRDITPDTVKPVHTENSIVTPRFVPITNYVPMPGYYYQTKALVSDGAGTDKNASDPTVLEENIITFYYMYDYAHAAYSIEYYQKGIDGAYSQITSIQNTADKGATIKAGTTFEILTFEGFECDHAEVVTYTETGAVANTKEIVKAEVGGISETLPQYGLTIRIYYARQEYRYQIVYREYGVDGDAGILYYINESGSTVTDDPNETEPFDKVITHTAPNELKKGEVEYTFYVDNSTEEQRTQSMSIRTTTSGPNVLIFYFKMHETTVVYQAMCTVAGATNFGTVSMFSERAATATSLSGSIAQPAYGFEFAGWYTDATMTTKVDESWVSDPDTSDGDATETKLRPTTLANNQDTVTYYAFFAPVATTMELVHTGVTGSDNFLFHIQGIDKTAYIDMIVSINGSGNVVLTNLPVGQYTITLLTDWSWEYSTTGITAVNVQGGAVSLQSVSQITITVVVQDVGSTNNVITFTSAAKATDWLGSESST